MRVSKPKAATWRERTPSPAKNSMKRIELVTASGGVDESGGVFRAAGVPLFPASHAPPHLGTFALFLPRPFFLGAGCMKASVEPEARPHEVIGWFPKQRRQTCLRPFGQGREHAPLL